MGVAVAGGKLDDAEGVAMGDQPHGFAVDGDHGTEVQPFGQIALVYVVGHERPFAGASSPPAPVKGSL